jgi:hypothetical protein
MCCCRCSPFDSDHAMKMLYTTKEIKQEIDALFSDTKRRRVAIVAFVGNDAEAYLRKPEGLELICWPKAGGTSATTVKKLQNAGANVRFADNLHMKLYWAEGKGAIITSANLSTSALGAGNLKEIGIRVPASTIDIKKVIREVKPYDVTSQQLVTLERQNAHLSNVTRMFKQTSITFAEWYESGQLRQLKLGYWCEHANFCKEAIERARRDYGVKPRNYIESYEKDFHKEGDCYLSFRIKERRDGTFEIPQKSPMKWGNVDFVVKDSTQRSSYQAVQVYRDNVYSMPFRLDQRFKAAFVKAANEYGIKKIYNAKTSLAPQRLVKLIDKHYTAC